jgi:hypothetical protein
LVDPVGEAVEYPLPIAAYPVTEAKIAYLARFMQIN